MPTTESLGTFAKAIKSNDASRVTDVLLHFQDLKDTINDPLPGLSFDSPPLLTAVWHRNKEMIDVLLRAGADINARTRWWAGGFGVLDGVAPDLAPFLIERGARVDAHAAAHLGMRDRLDELVSADPSLVHARGGDGQTPLHFSSSVDIAKYLLDRDAHIDARDVDHESTAAQYMVRDRQEVARYLVGRGCQTDLLMAAALGDLALVTRHLDANPECIRMTVSEEYFPKANPHSGGTIYTWTLGAHKTAHVIAREFGHEDVFQLLMDRSPVEVKLAQACELGDEATCNALVASDPDLAKSVSPGEGRKVADAAQNNNLDAVRLLLKAGWPVDARGQHNATPLHWAAFHGNAAMAREILRHHPPLEIRGDDFDLTPLGWAIYGSLHGWHCRTGDYAGTVETLLQAGAQAPPLMDSLEASEPVRAVLRKHVGPGV
jgi:ankyrin repeat protein